MLARIKAIINIFRDYYYTKVRPKDSLIFQWANYCYFYHIYNRTWRNAKAVEISIIRNIAKEKEVRTNPEVGNFFRLLLYRSRHHRQIWKAKTVINEDVVKFYSTKKYDFLIISISTLEYVGWNEDPRDPGKVIRAIENLLELLSPSGKIICHTTPGL